VSKNVITRVVLRRLVAIVTASLLGAGPANGNVSPLGVVTHAEHAQLGQVTASPGSTVYDGDNVSTGLGGSLRVTARGVTLQLPAQSSFTVRQRSQVDGGILAELAHGVLVFAAAPNASISVVADNASIRPAKNSAVVAFVRLVDKKELRISVQRGAVEFSYRGETAIIAEGETYKVLLDPSEKEIAAASESGQPGEKAATHHPVLLQHPTFLLIAIGIAATAIAVPMLMHSAESPDRPGP
jgi:FecR protein